MSDITSEAIKYIENSPFATLITVSQEHKPFARYIGPVVNYGLNIYFVTRLDSTKINHIDQNPHVTLCFQKANQNKEDFRCVVINGTAIRVSEKKECDFFLQKLSQISSGYEEYIRNDGFKTWSIYKVTGTTLQFTSTDFNKKTRTITEDI